MKRISNKYIIYVFKIEYVVSKIIFYFVHYLMTEIKYLFQKAEIQFKLNYLETVSNNNEFNNTSQSLTSPTVGQ